MFTKSRMRARRDKAIRFLFAIALLVQLLAVTGLAQSTFGTFLGTVRDPSGAVVPNSVVTLTNTGTAAQRTATTDASGGYVLVNIEPGAYRLTVQAPGFQPANFTNLQLTARQTSRIDAVVNVATQVETVNVSGTTEQVITTDVSNIAETKSSRELVNLPIAIGSRAGGSTSPMSTLTTNAGVQTDPGGGISVAGSKPSMLSISIDGISSMNPRNAAPLGELFPSFNSIAEIRVSELNNTAEFGGISDITTISKSGTNALHGGGFENVQNTSLTARNTFSATKPILHMNDFGFFVGGPVVIPKLYNGKDKTFFFGAFEALRLPKQLVVVQSVPSLALRRGDLSVYPNPVYNPKTGLPFQGNQIPLADQDPIALNALKYLFPLPNTGGPNALANNFQVNAPTPIKSNQGDLRLDQSLGSKQTIFARGTYKRRSVITAPGVGSTGSGVPIVNGSYLAIGEVSAPEIDYGLSVAHNYIISPTMVNEFRTGFNGSHIKVAWGQSARQGIALLGNGYAVPQAPDGGAPVDFRIAGFQRTGGSRTDHQENNTVQILDNLTSTLGKHTLKVGGSIKWMDAYYANVFATTRVGRFNYNGSVTNQIVNGHPYIGNPYGAFLLGVTDQTRIAHVLFADTNAYSKDYAVYVQDDWHVTSRLTVNYGLRYEYHPMFMDHFNNTAQVDPNYTSIVNGTLVRGRVVIPDLGVKLLNPQFVESISPTPVQTASQAGFPQSLRYSQKTDFAPRIGFAWRPFADGKTVIRGGYGRFIEATLGNLITRAWAVSATNYAVFNQQIINGKPKLTFPQPWPTNIAQPGNQSFYDAGDIHYKDPFVQQWNFTVERNLGYNIGLRVSYDGSHGSDLGTFQDLNQLPANTDGYKQANAPFPIWQVIAYSTNGGWSNYHALTAAINKRFSSGLQFQSSYAFGRNLSNAAGYDGGAAIGSGNNVGFVGEAGGNPSDRYNLGQDYGNVAFTHRHRSMSTFLYQLPFGKGGKLGRNANGFVDGIIGGWEVAGVLLFQTGPFLTATVPGPDPQGNNAPNVIGDVRPDRVSGVSLYPATQTWGNWLNPAAFKKPGSNIGRFGNSSVGNIIGPGTQAVSMSLMKSIKINENLSIQFGAQASNLFNHPNYAPPSTSLDGSTFGTLSNLQPVENGGPRSIQGTVKVTF